MMTLRALAITSNIAFIGYGYLGELWPILILHAAMLPVNIHRLRREVLLERPSDKVQRFWTRHSGKLDGDHLSVRSSTQRRYPVAAHSREQQCETRPAAD